MKYALIRDELVGTCTTRMRPEAFEATERARRIGMGVHDWCAGPMSRDESGSTPQR